MQSLERGAHEHAQREIEFQIEFTAAKNILDKISAVAKYIETLPADSRGEKICEIIKNTGFLNLINATAIASLAIKCKIDASGASYIADNLFNPQKGRDVASKERFIQICATKIAGIEFISTSIQPAPDVKPSTSLQLSENGLIDHRHRF
jgi:hypothetical protein